MSEWIENKTKRMWMRWMAGVWYGFLACCDDDDDDKRAKDKGGMKEGFPSSRQSPGNSISSEISRL
jgi:hypothetical protein